MDRRTKRSFHPRADLRSLLWLPPALRLLCGFGEALLSVCLFFFVTQIPVQHSGKNSCLLAYCLLSTILCCRFFLFLPRNNHLQILSFPLNAGRFDVHNQKLHSSQRCHRVIMPSVRCSWGRCGAGEVLRHPAACQITRRGCLRIRPFPDG